MADLNGLGTIEPKWSGNINSEVNEGNTGMIEFVDLVETGVEAAGERRAGCVERALGDGMVCGVEVEADDVANGSVKLVWAVDEITVCSDHDVVGSSCMEGGGCAACWWWGRNAG